MNFELTDEQRLLREAAAEALSRQDTVAAAREAADGAEPLDLWPVAREAGWSGLLIAAEREGAGLGPFDAMLIAEQCGRRLASAGLLGHLPATLAIQRAAEAGDEIAAGALPALASGERRAAIVHAAPPLGAGGWSVDSPDGRRRRQQAPTSEGGGDAVRISGAAGFQPDLAGADLLVVPARDASGALRAHLLEPTHEGVQVESVRRFDHSRPLGHLRLTGAPAAALATTPEAIGECWHLGQMLLAGDAIGVADSAREMAVAYAIDRHAFGRPIGSYQAVKHQLVEMLRASETARSLSFYAGLVADSRSGELARAAACVRFAAERAASFATRACIAVHGGIGNTWEHDAPFYWRRAQLSRLLLGGEAGAGERVAEEVIAAARARSSDPATASAINEI